MCDCHRLSAIAAIGARQHGTRLGRLSIQLLPWLFTFLARALPGQSHSWRALASHVTVPGALASHVTVPGALVSHVTVSGALVSHVTVPGALASHVPRALQIPAEQTVPPPPAEAQANLSAAVVAYYVFCSVLFVCLLFVCSDVVIRLV